METKTWLTIFTWTNILSALMIGAMGIYQIITFAHFKNFDFFQIWSIFTPIYMLIFSGMLLALEYKSEPVIEYFQFLTSFIGRGVFYIFLGSIASYDPSAQFLGWVWGLILWIVGIFYIVLHFAAPDGALAEIKDGFAAKYGVV